MGDDHSQSDSHMADLIGEADAALSSTPSQNHMDLSTYLVPYHEPRAVRGPQTDTKNTPVSLESQHVPFDLESREVSALLDYLNDLSIDSPLRRTVDSPNRAPDPRGALRSGECCDMTTATPAIRVIQMLTPAQRTTLRDRLNQTSLSGMKPTFKDFKSLERATPRQTKAVGGARENSRAFSTPRTASTQWSHRKAKRSNATISTTVVS
jgi:hypothetical protein